MSASPRRPLLALLLMLPLPAFAQAPAECPTAHCGPSSRQPPSSLQLWSEAAAIHRLKLVFVDALQRFTRAQAGTFGDEGEALVEGLTSMTGALARWDAAVQRLQADADRLPPSADLHVVIATVLLDGQRVSEALRELEAADRLDGGRADIHSLRALAYALTNRSADAVRALRTAAAINPDHPPTFYALAQHLARLNRGDEAAEALRGFQRALLRDHAAAPATARAPFERVDLLRQVAGAAPIFPQGRYGPGFAALSEGRYAAALASFTAAARTDPLLSGDTSVRQHLARAAQALGDGQIGAALEVLHAAVANAPAHSETYRLLGLVYWIDGQHGRSIEQLRSAIHLAPADERARILLADVLLSEGRLSEAERELQQSLEAGVRSGQIHYRLAQLYLRRSLLPQAVSELESSEQFGPVVGRDRFYQLLGSIRVDRADFDGAVSAYARRIDVNPNLGEAHRQLGEIYFLQGRHEEALAEFSAASWLDPADARAHAAAAHVHMRLARYTDAAAAARRAVALDPGHRQARYALGMALMRLGEVGDATRELATFERLEAEVAAADRRAFHLDGLRREAARAAGAGLPERALALFEEILAVDPRDARSHRDLGAALLRARRPQDALPHLVAAQRAVETLEGFRQLADAFNAAGDRASAATQIARYHEAVAQAKMDRIRELAGAR